MLCSVFWFVSSNYITGINESKDLLCSVHYCVASALKVLGFTVEIKKYSLRK